MVLMFAKVLGLTSTSKFLLAVLDQLFSEDTHTFIEVFNLFQVKVNETYRKNDSWPTCKCFYFCASISESCQKSLQKSDFSHYI